MPEENEIGSFREIWSDLSETPTTLWLFSLAVLMVGIGLIVSSKIPSPLGWTAHEPAELARDIGIALIVAPVVTIVYEAGTRRSAQLNAMSSLLNVTMRSFVTDELWQEIKEQVVKRNRTRRNIEIKVRVLREVEVNNTQKTLPDDVIILEIEYGYDLHRLIAEDRKVDITHALDIHMRDEAFRVPCFRWIDVQVEGQSQPYRFKDEELAKLYDPGSGVFSCSLALPAGSAARIVSNRYEKVFVPGMYTLFMPELITHPDDAKSDSRTIHITVENLPENLEANATTWFAPHELVLEKTNEWSFKRPMLPGQGIGLTFTKRVLLLTGKTISVSKESATSASIDRPTTRVSAQNEPSTTAPPKPATTTERD